MPLCLLERYGRPVPYIEALDRQRIVASRVLAGEAPDTLLLLEHPPTITLTRTTKDDELRTNVDALSARGIAVVETDRGGRSTYHGPGQLVGYPILDLRRYGQDLHTYLRRLETALIAALASLDVPACTIPGLTGVWVHDRKIAAIGIKARHWVTMHGFSLNVNPDLMPMREDLVPCGLHGRDVTSIAELLGPDGPGREEAERAVLDALADVLGLEYSL